MSTRPVQPRPPWGTKSTNNYSAQNEMSKADWIASAPTILMVAGFDILAENNFGAHLIVRYPGLSAEIHVWPSTGRWRFRNATLNNWGAGSEGAPRYHGVRGLIRFVESLDARIDF